jgi:uncharacterized membrane protein YcaP (DUF421 family)
MCTLLGLGVEPKELTFFQISLRGIIIFAATIVLVRLSDRRSLTKKSPFDQIFVVVVASILARAINGSATFFASIGGAAVLVAVHRILAFACYHSRILAKALKGRAYVLIRNGNLDYRVMRRHHLPIEDASEDLRLSAKEEDFDQVKTGRLEASGDISFILKKRTA